MASMTGPLDPNLAARLTISINGLFAGSYLAGVFYGLTTHQTFVYFRRSGKDPLYTRFFVLLLWILDTLHAVFSAVALLKLTEESIANPLSILLNHVPWTLSFSLFMMSLSDSGFTVIESGDYVPPPLPTRRNSSSLMDAIDQIFPVICALVAGLYTASKTVRKTGLQALDIVTELDTTLISICVADSILAGSLCVLLWNSRSGIKRSLLATLNRREKIRTQMEATIGMISIPLDSTGNSSAFKRVSIPIFASHDSDDVSTTTRSGIRTGTQKSDAEA
ncbi:hypothetical protein CVT25_008419 [Psilocybe cyanescens]|uniref:Uncharacterized protein n=1 Tax=Psilocybe cyanescens TaxID=93625 RepID=A0A409WUZ0_PSICY|nr:hypothetical protein CVT25_008419 [Psilocybe cyanescens]